VAVKLPSGKPFAVALTMLLVFALIGLVISVLIPRAPAGRPEEEAPGAPRASGREPTSAEERTWAVPPQPERGPDDRRTDDPERRRRPAGSGP
jgi:hypothetical protein